METGKASSSNPAKGQKRKNDEQEAGPVKVRKRRTEGGCTECDRLQISCDNKVVCGNCSRSGRPCIYPGTNVFEQSPTCKEKDAKIRELESRVKNLEKVVFQILQSYPVPNQAPAPGVFGTRASPTPTTYNITRAPGTNIASNAPVLTGNDLDFLDFGNPGTAHDEPVSPDPAIHTSDFTSTSSTSGALRQTNITGWEDFLNLDVSGTETAHDDPGLQGDAGYPADFNDTNTIFGMLASVNNEIPEDLLEQMRAAS